MRILDSLVKVTIVSILIVLIFIAYEVNIINEKSSNFYEYQNSKINIKQVKNILPRVEYVITIEQDEEKDMFRKYSTTLNEEEIEKIKKFLQLAKKSEFYTVQIFTYMIFDKRRVELYHSDNYLKKASSYTLSENLLKHLVEHGIDEFQYKNLTKIKGVVYTQREKFLADVASYGKLRRDQWFENNIAMMAVKDNAARFMSQINLQHKEKLLNDEEIEKIVKMIEESYEEYKGIK
ncbi:hypothetical protein GJV85_12435 [Sulfurimonas aquatica]|uniref:Uncharacterized protein n=1 Tax=Sulfurimonas aquatica TaxID=2672570 RepID=A0A975B274_9BACT|nr:hypothetical protein [Sulfurimonas aquatica]QSZ42881.1 hypothetical protein GJV85_12435 [Sulfurimonas aquatica]